MDLFAGARIWLPCEVKPGPFSDERMVLVVADGNEWFGFVNVRWLRRHGSEDTDEVLAKVIDVDGPTFHARISGNALQAKLFQGRVEHAVPVILSKPEIGRRPDSERLVVDPIPRSKRRRSADALWPDGENAVWRFEDPIPP